MKYHTTTQAAKILGKCARQVQRYCEQGKLGERIGRNWAIAETELKAFKIVRTQGKL